MSETVFWGWEGVALLLWAGWCHYVLYVWEPPARKAP